MYWSEDPVLDAERYMAAQERRLRKRPVCDCCQEHIQDESALHYKGIWLCEKCRNIHDEYIEVEE
jgi:ribosomal protein L37AE/L43A